VYLLITIDTEGDNAWARKGYENCTRNARFLPKFQELCEKFGFKPTYLTSYEMAKDDFFVEFASDALKRNRCEVGLHPHPWNMPPEYKLTSHDMILHPYMIEYPANIIREKVKVLTDLLQEQLGAKVCSHRAARWAFNSTYAKILCEFGYKVDCSVAPYVPDILPSRSGPDAIKVVLPDYSVFSAEPYFCDEHDISKAGKMPLLEVPMTIVPNYGRILSDIYYNWIPRGTWQLLFRGIFGRPQKWFRPTHRRAGDLTDVAKRKMRQDSDYIMFMIHSSELMPGGNPQFKNTRAINKCYASIEGVFQWLHQKGCMGVTCSEFYDLYLKGDP